MSENPHSISDWKELALKDAEHAAEVLLSRLNAIAPDTRDKVFAALPEREEVIRFFDTAAASTGALSGVPYFLKDLFDFPGYQTTASSSFLEKLRPSPPEESSLSLALRSQGAVFAGKTHLNEFAYGLSGENPTFGDCPHPIFPEKLSGGSSSGSAWAVRSGIVPIATGTDTGGSIRVPAAWCGIYGLRLSPNDWSTQGCFPLAPSFDTAGWFCSSAEDMSKSIQAMLSPPASNSTRPLKGASLLDSIKGLSPEFRAKASDTLECLNAQSASAGSEAFEAATQSVAFHYSVIQSMEALEVHKGWLDEQKENYDPVVYQRIERARHWTSEQIRQARTCETQVRAFFESSFQNYDFVAIPATQSPAISSAEHTDAFRSELLSITAPGSIARCPVLTIPIQLKDGTSQGIQILYKDESSDLPLRVIEQLKQNA